MENRFQKSSFSKRLPYVLLSFCVIFVAFLSYVYFSTSPLSKKSSSVTPTIMLQPTQTVALVRIKRGDEEEFIAGPKCSELFKIFQDIRFKAMIAARAEGKDINVENLKIEYNKIADVNQDGKVDSSDEATILKNMKDEKWCQEILK